MINKNLPKVFMTIVLAAVASSFLFTAPAFSQTEKDRAQLQKELQRSMAKEPPLTEEDFRIYMANLESIFNLRQSPERAGEVAASISGWSETRFAYVTTKMAVGMSMLLKPEDPRNAAAPEFARPTPSEMNLIRRHRDELVKAVEALQAGRAN